MAATDAKPVPKKNVAFRVTVPIYDADGDLVSGATGLDSEVSLDGATFADCTNEATEIATSSGMYFLDLTAAEMNADTVAILIKTTTSGAKTTAVVLYPEETGDIRADITSINGNSGGVAGLDRAARCIAVGTIGAGSTTTSVVSSALTPSGSATDQFKGQILAFDKDTTTAALRGQKTDITASSSSATPTFTVTALTTAPQSGDTFTIE